jgi:lysophospholipase
MISGFSPNTNNPDSNWGICLQCAVFDRARSKIIPAIPRSSFCSQCFIQYCYDPNNPPNKSQLPNRQLVFVDPDPQGISKIQAFFANNKFKLIGGLIGLLGFIGLSLIVM